MNLAFLILILPSFRPSLPVSPAWLVLLVSWKATALARRSSAMAGHRPPNLGGSLVVDDDEERDMVRQLAVS